MRGVRVGYGSVVVLQDVDLTVADGEVVAVTGVNGAGKSALLSCLAGLHRPAAGTVTVLAARRATTRGSGGRSPWSATSRPDIRG